MKYIWLVAIREYAENARTKGFWIGILIFPILLTVAIKVQTFLETKGTPTRYYALADLSGEWDADVQASIDAMNEGAVERARTAWWSEQQALPAEERTEFEPPEADYVRVSLPDWVETDDPDAMVESLKPYLSGDQELEHEDGTVELFALLVVDEDFGERANAGRYSGIEYWCKNFADDDLSDAVEDGLAAKFRRDEYVAQGVEVDEIGRIDELRVSLTSKDPTREAGEEDVSMFDRIRQMAPIAFVYLLFVAIFSVSQMLLNNTVEEKSNRIVEVLFSSITAWELMLGKLLGIALIGFTMLGSWVVLGMGALYGMWEGDAETLNSILAEIFNRELMVPFAFYFAMGYVFYASIFLAIGSLCNTIKDAQNFMGPLMMVSIVPLFTMAFIPRDPHGPIAVTLSWIPPWTPFVMMNRAAASPPTFDLVGTGLLLVVSVAFTVWLSGRVFQTAILRTGEPPKLLELVRWLRT